MDVRRGIKMKRCWICNKIIWPWQSSIDKTGEIHSRCLKKNQVVRPPYTIKRGNSIVFYKTDNPFGFMELWEKAMSRVEKNKNYIPIVPIEVDSEIEVYNFTRKKRRLKK